MSNATSGGVPQQRSSKFIAPSTMQRAAAIAEAAGTVYDYDNLKHINSIKAHQLVHYAKDRGAQLPALDHVLKAHYLQGRGVENVQDLFDLGAELGFDRDDVVRALEADDYLAAVHADLDQARSLDIRVVPFFIVDGSTCCRARKSRRPTPSCCASFPTSGPK